jgi:uncharacterized DUF497 family protein
MFVWDEPKRLKVIDEHRIDFALIGDVFNDPFGVYFEDVAHSTADDIRFSLIGFAPLYGLIHVTFTYRKELIRLITARKAEQWMVSEYEQYKG